MTQVTSDRDQQQTGRKRALLIAGPTASGKSALAIRLANQLGGVVVNMDSMQIYRDLAVITARPSRRDEQAAPHRLYGHVDGAENYSVGRYVVDAVPVVAAIHQQRLLPIFVGGTGLYATALLYGLSDMPVVPDAVRIKVRSDAEGHETPELHSRLEMIDPEAASNLRPSDRLRILRALEVVIATNAPLSAAHAIKKPGLLQGMRTECYFLAPDRDALRGAINHRFEAMMTGGALDEVATLGARQLDHMLPVMRAHGVPALLSYLRGEMSLADAIMRGQGDTRAYVKRQFTWFKNQLPEFKPIAPAEAEAFILREVG
jgi:tRNA dimethylallyltransferase